MLELFDQADGGLQGPKDLFEIFARRRLPNGRGVRTLPPAFTATFEGWERYIERQHQKMGIGGVWETVLVYLRRDTARAIPLAELTALVDDLSTDNAELESILGQAADHATLGQLTDALREQEGSTNKVAARPWELNGLVTGLKGSEITADSRLANAIQLLALLVVQRQQRKQSIPGFSEGMHRGGEIDRLPLSWFEVELSRRGDLPIREVIRWIMEYCVIGQATRIAFEKLTQGDRFFIRRDVNGYRLTRDPGRSHFAFDSDRLFGATSLLHELGYVDMDDGIRITAAGRRLRDRLSTLPALSEID